MSIFSDITGWDTKISEYRRIASEEGFDAALDKFTEEFGKEASEQFYKILNLDTPGSGNLPGDYELNQSKYDFRNLAFPVDLGAKGSYHGHYMVININVSDYTNFGSIARGNPGASTNSGASGSYGVGRATTKSTQLFTKLDSELSKVDVLRANLDRTYSSGGKPLTVGAFVPRRTRRVAESIALYIPNTMVFSTRNAYEDVGLTELAFRAVQTGISAVSDTVGRFVSGATGILSTVAAVRQQPINPRVEVLFSTSALRQFQFDFLFAPSSAQESEALESIIQTLRFHAAPEYNPVASGVDALKALLWTPPSEFDITFFNRGSENLSIPRINTCIMESIDVDYAPSGVYSTFSNGKPVQVRMQLGFKEVEIVHKLRVVQGF